MSEQYFGADFILCEKVCVICRNIGTGVLSDPPYCSSECFSVDYPPEKKDEQ